MRRREFVSLAGSLFGVVASSPFAARAQEPGRIYHLGDLHLSPRNAPWNVALFEAVKGDGFIVGQNLIVDDAGFGLSSEKVAEHARALANSQVDVITAAGDPVVRAVPQATKSVPVLAISEDLVGGGFVASLAEPKGNITGVSILSTTSTANDRKSSSTHCRGPSRWRSWPTLKVPRRNNCRRCKRRRTHAELSPLSAQ